MSTVETPGIIAKVSATMVNHILPAVRVKNQFLRDGSRKITVRMIKPDYKASSALIGLRPWRQYTKP